MFFTRIKMYYKLNKSIFIRNINGYLQIVDATNKNEILGNYSSYLFLKHLNYKPQSIDSIVVNICSEFSGEVSLKEVREDAICLFNQMNTFGVVQIGNTFEDCLEKTYKDIIKPTILLPKEEVDNFLSLRKKHPFLHSVSIEITQKCNERCIHCYIPHENKNIKLNDIDFYRIIDQCHELGTVVDIKLTGGECMSHPSFTKYARYIKDKGFALSILTNLTLLNDEIIEILKEGTLSNVQVSMFSMDPKVHDEITMLPGSLKTVLQNIEKLKSAGIYISIATQVMELNKGSIKDLYEYAQEQDINLRCDWTIISKEDRTHDNLKYRIKDTSFYKDICKLRMKYNEDYKEEIKKELLREPKSEYTHLCNAGTNGIYIDTNLNVHPCPGWDLDLGSLKTNSLSNIWNNSETLKKVRNIVLKNFPKCRKCDIRNLCSICMAQADLEETAKNFKFKMPDYCCSMYHVIYDTIMEE